ncbi:MAG: hypothetical protein Q9222_001725 [Ikaeria aurantiellina]
MRCNEDGFTTKDVEALCDIKQSTKTTTSAIGKKGIGFKSVFKISDVVHIRSNGFQFCFDRKDGPFGMDLQPSVLLFLRNIEELSIKTPFSHKDMTCTGRREQIASVETTPMPVEDDDDNDDGSIISARTQYMMFRSELESLDTEIVLAFPCTPGRGLRTQQVHNFLPMRDYGFKFIIHADFHLTSNREGIDRSDKKNVALAQALPALFLAAVNRTNESYADSAKWIRYLPRPGTLQDIFETIDFVEHLSKEPVLYSRTKKLMLPSKLIYAPNNFRFNKKHFVPLEFDGRQILSTLYDHSEISQLERLGVTKLTRKMFVRALKILGDKGWPEIDWHDDLAKILLKIDRDCLADIPLIPIAGSSPTVWIKAQDVEKTPVFFQTDSGVSQVPEGVKFRLLLDSASASKSRRDLFEKLGVRSLDASAVCEEIECILGGPNPKVSIAAAVSQTKYLFRHRDSYPKPEIMFCSRDRRKGFTWESADDLYFDDHREGSYQISQLLGSMPYFQCLHPDYLEGGVNPDTESWMDWLKERGLSNSIRPVAQDCSQPSPEFAFFAMEASQQQLCDVLVRNRGLYEQHKGVLSRPLRQRFDQKVLPSNRLRSRAHRLGVPHSWGRYLEMQVVKAEYEWLKNFGLITSRYSARFYLQILRYHAWSSTEMQVLHRIYKSMQDCSDIHEIRFVVLHASTYTLTKY